jgi:hypothetical protein
MWDDPAIAVRRPAPDEAIISQKGRNCPPACRGGEQLRVLIFLDYGFVSFLGVV